MVHSILVRHETNRVLGNHSCELPDGQPGRDLVIAAHQSLTREWWEYRQQDFEVFVSQLVIDEAAAGDPSASSLRLQVLAGIPLLELKESALQLAESLVSEGPLPRKAAEDALHIALAAVHGMDFLLTWNCRHIANAEMRSAVGRICRERGYEPPVTCTPEELLGVR